MRGQPLLDLGVGGGRTLPLLRELSDDYTGIDYSAELVAAARRRFPQARIEIGDARDLSRFAASRFALVFFSFNGIDGITHDERGQVFREVLRVLRPRGLFAYSTNNLDTPDTGIWRRGASQLLRNPQRALHYAKAPPARAHDPAPVGRGPGEPRRLDAARLAELRPLPRHPPHQPR